MTLFRPSPNPCHPTTSNTNLHGFLECRVNERYCRCVAKIVPLPKAKNTQHNISTSSERSILPCGASTSQSSPRIQPPMPLRLGKRTIAQLSPGACVIALEKVPFTSDLLLDSLRICIAHVMGRLWPLSKYMMG